MVIRCFISAFYTQNDQIQCIHSPSLCMLGNFFTIYLRLLIIFKINFFKKFFQRPIQRSLAVLMPRFTHYESRRVPNQRAPANAHIVELASGIPSECKKVLIQIRPDILSGLIRIPNCLQRLSADDNGW